MAETKYMAVSLITDGKFRNVMITKEMIGELAKELRTKGKTQLHFAEGSIEVEGFSVLALKSEHSLICVPSPDIIN